jgi:hypothetical protein
MSIRHIVKCDYCGVEVPATAVTDAWVTVRVSAFGDHDACSWPCLREVLSKLWKLADREVQSIEAREVLSGAARQVPRPKRDEAEGGDDILWRRGRAG